MKLYKINNQYYVVAKNYSEVESYLLYKFAFNEDIESIELIANNVIVVNDYE